MYNKNYNKELGLDTGEKIVPLRYLIPLTFLAALCWIGATILSHRARTDQPVSKDHSSLSTRS